MNHRLIKSGRIDGRAFNGGARKGAGRPISVLDRYYIKFALEKVVVREFRHGQIRRVKKTRLQVAMDKLFKMSMEGNLKAIRVFLDRTMGKPGIDRSERRERVKDHSRYEFEQLLEFAYGNPSTRPSLASFSRKEGIEVDDLIESIFEATDAISKGKFLPKPPFTNPPKTS